MRDSDNDRLPLFRTPVEVEKLTDRLSEKHRYVFLGSCFAAHIGEHFTDAGLQVMVNPMGVLYNPESIAQVIRFAILPGAERCIGEEWYVECEGRTHSWLGSSVVSGLTYADCEAKVTGAFDSLHDRLLEADYLFITLGSNHCYMLRDGRVVSNCHKVPQKQFAEYEMSVDDVEMSFVEVLDSLFALNDHVRVVFTVSPYRYRKYGFHGSQLGKAALLLGIDKLQERYGSRMLYFPAYEIVMDELRDYRFYDEDMLHPSSQAVDYIWQRLQSMWMDESMTAHIAQMQAINKAKGHREK